ncbi:MAG: tetratricopeptide repeat protein [Treponema sp.]|nr:tetratricopeptide repeat protein [Treponema sp.]
MKKLSAIIICVLFSISAFSLDLNLRVTPGIVAPLKSDRYKTGFGVFAQGDLDFFGFMNAGVEGNVLLTSATGINESLSFAGGGLGLSFYYAPLSRLHLGAGFAFGPYITSGVISSSGLYWRTYGEVGFRATPELTLSFTGNFIDYETIRNGRFLNGINAGIGLKYVIPIGKKGSSSLTASFVQDEAAFPLFMTAYRNFELGTITLKNNEASEIRNVHVRFRAGKYTASTYESANIPVVQKHSSVEVPLLADFSTEILKYSENGRINGELIIEYELLGKKKHSEQNIILSMNNRNAFCWADPTAISAFISSGTPEVQQLASIISGVETNHLIQGMNKNLQMSAAIFEGLRLFGIIYSEDKITPFVDYHKVYDMDSIQYPLQTMTYLSGDYDDIGILLASCLESVGVPTGYMILDDDFILLIGTNIRVGTELNHFASSDGLLIDDENVYFGLSMADFQKGFTQSRATAFEKIAAAKKEIDIPYDYVNTEYAWAIYSPAVFSSSGNVFEYPTRVEIEKATKKAIDDYINSDLAVVVERAKASKDPNKIGVALFRSGKIKDAKAQFSKSDSISCLNNLANCYMAEKDYDSAAKTYEKVLAKDSSNKIATKGLNSANEKLGR